MLLLSRATGTFQFTNADALTLRLVRMSDGQLMNTGGTTSAVTVKLHFTTNIFVLLFLMALIYKSYYLVINHRPSQIFALGPPRSSPFCRHQEFNMIVKKFKLTFSFFLIMHYALVAGFFYEHQLVIIE